MKKMCNEFFILQQCQWAYAAPPKWRRQMDRWLNMGLTRIA
jgi:hypothetical protein